MLILFNLCISKKLKLLTIYSFIALLQENLVIVQSFIPRLTFAFIDFVTPMGKLSSSLFTLTPNFDGLFVNNHATMGYMIWDWKGNMIQAGTIQFNRSSQLYFIIKNTIQLMGEVSMIMLHHYIREANGVADWLLQIWLVCFLPNYLCSWDSSPSSWFSFILLVNNLSTIFVRSTTQISLYVYLFFKKKKRKKKIRAQKHPQEINYGKGESYVEGTTNPL